MCNRALYTYINYVHICTHTGTRCIHCVHGAATGLWLMIRNLEAATSVTLPILSLLDAQKIISHGGSRRIWEDNTIFELAFMTQRDWIHLAQDGEASRSLRTSGLMVNKRLHQTSDSSVKKGRWVGVANLSTPVLLYHEDELHFITRLMWGVHLIFML